MITECVKILSVHQNNINVVKSYGVAQPISPIAPPDSRPTATWESLRATHRLPADAHVRQVSMSHAWFKASDTPFWPVDL